MSLSKKHYIAISDIIRNNYESTKTDGEYGAIINTKIISDLATYFRDENLKRLDRVKGARFTFDQCKFIEACFPNIKIKNGVLGDDWKHRKGGK